MLINRLGRTANWRRSDLDFEAEINSSELHGMLISRFGEAEITTTISLKLPTRAAMKRFTHQS